MPDGKNLLYFPDLSNPKDRRKATQEDLAKLQESIRFSDSRKEAVKGITEALGADLTPDKFWAFFPRDFENELARKELDFRGRSSVEIEQTVFLISIGNGQPEIVVVDQITKKLP